jgi:hypothetical protein
VPGIVDSDFTELLVSMKRIKEAAIESISTFDENMIQILDEYIHFQNKLNTYVNKVSFE